MSSAPWSQNYITFTYKTKKCMPISVQRTSWTPLFKCFTQNRDKKGKVLFTELTVQANGET